MSDTFAEDFAAALLQARRTGVRVAADTAAAFSAKATRDDVDRVQHLVSLECGPVGAWKTAPGEGRPMIAPIFLADVRPSKAGFTTSEIATCGIELEVAFRLDSALPATDSPDFEAAARAAVTPMAVIEVVHSRCEELGDAGAAAKLADNQMNGGLVIGAPGSADASFDTPNVRLAFDGAVVVEGRQSVPGGDAFASFLAFARAVGDHCGGLQPGHIVTTGSLTGMLFIDPGTLVEGEIEGLGTVTTAYR